MMYPYPDTLSTDLYIPNDRPVERFNPLYSRALLKAIIGFGLLGSLTTIPTHATYAENNSLNNTTNIVEIAEYGDVSYHETKQERLIDISTIKRIKIKIGKIEKLKFQSVEDENGFI